MKRKPKASEDTVPFPTFNFWSAARALLIVNAIARRAQRIQARKDKAA